MAFSSEAAHRLCSLAPTVAIAGWTLRLTSAGTDQHKRDFFGVDRHPFLELVIIERGRGRAEHPQQAVAVDGPTLIIAAPDEPHRLIGDRRRRMVLTWLALAVSGVPEPGHLAARWLRGHRSVIPLPAEVAADLAALERECAAAGPAWTLAATDRLRLLLISALRQTSDDPGTAEAADEDGALVAAFLDAVRRHPALGPAEIARHLGLHQRRLTRLARRALGCSPLVAITRERLVLARHELSDPARSVAEIARRLGYADPRHFARVFRTATGESPAHWRRERYRR
jgi:AraC-like DNA-binding protein